MSDTVPTPPRREPVALTITAHAETVSKVAVQDIARGGDDHLVSLFLGDDRSGLRLLGQHADVLDVVSKALISLLRVHDDEAANDALQRLGYLILHGQDTPEVCERCGERPPRLGRLWCGPCCDQADDMVPQEPTGPTVAEGDEGGHDIGCGQ